MAVAIILEFKGATLEQYDDVVARMGLTAGGKAPPGALFHWVTATDDGILVTDVWESREQFERFAQEHIGPQSQAAGIEAEPEMTFHEVHNHFSAG